MKTVARDTAPNSINHNRNGHHHHNNRYPDAPLYAIGYSLGANLLVKYLGEEGRNGFRPLAGAVSVSNPWNFEHNTMAGGRAKGLVAAVMGKVYSWALATGVKVTPGVFRFLL